MESLNQKPDVDDFLDLNALARHACMSKRTLMTWLHHPLTPIPYRKIGQKILVSRAEFRAWADRFKVTPDTTDVQAIVDELVGRQ